MAYRSRYKSDEIDYLFRAILTLENEEDCYRFFEDVCTVKEIKSMAQRMHVAALLNDKKTYADIENTTNASTATISRINKCLMYGAEGYKLVLDRMAEEEKK